MYNAFEKSRVTLSYKVRLLGPQNDEIDSFEYFDILNEEIPAMPHSLIGQVYFSFLVIISHRNKFQTWKIKYSYFLVTRRSLEEIKTNLKECR